MGQLSVDRAEIQRYVEAERRHGQESVGLLVTMPGSDPGRLAQLVRRVLREVPGEVTTYPTSFGCYTYVRAASAWTVTVDELSASVSGEELPHDVEVRITRPRRAAQSWWEVLREGRRPRAAALMGFSLSPAVPDRGWGVASDVTERLLEHAGPWVSVSGEEGEVFDGRRAIVLAPDDVVGVMSRMVRAFETCFDTWFPASTRGDGGRDISVDRWGQAAYVQAGAQLDNAAVAREMSEVLRHHAEHLDVGAVRPAQVNETRNFGYADPIWLQNRHLWATHVHQPNAIQVLTSAHMDRAHDLSSWTAEHVADDRWLVATADLGPWFDHVDDQGAQHVPPDVMTSAVRDFGDMLLTTEVAAAHPSAGVPPP
jgi:hypothetical protein